MGGVSRDQTRRPESFCSAMKRPHGFVLSPTNQFDTSLGSRRRSRGVKTVGRLPWPDTRRGVKSSHRLRWFPQSGDGST
jgi:hypothetical protein